MCYGDVTSTRMSAGWNPASLGLSGPGGRGSAWKPQEL